MARRSKSVTRWVFAFKDAATFLAASISRSVALTVAKTQRVKLEALLFGYGGGGGGVESAAEENDRVCAYHFCGELIFVPSTG